MWDFFYMYGNLPNTEKFSLCFFIKNCENAYIMTNENISHWFGIIFNFKYIILLQRDFRLIELLLFIKYQMHVKHDY